MPRSLACPVSCFLQVNCLLVDGVKRATEFSLGLLRGPPPPKGGRRERLYSSYLYLSLAARIASAAAQARPQSAQASTENERQTVLVQLHSERFMG